MNVILLEKVRNLGLLGDQVSVKSGYARNFLIPEGKAVFATKENISMFEGRKSELEAAEAEKLAQAKATAESLVDKVFTLESRSGDEGKLYGSIGSRDIADAINAEGFELEKKDIKLPEGPIRTLGEHKITLQLHSDVMIEVTIDVKATETPS